MYKSISKGQFDIYQSKKKVTVPIIPIKVDNVPAKRNRAQTTGAIDYPPVEKNVPMDLSIKESSFYKFNKGLKKKLSQYNIRGL